MKKLAAVLAIALAAIPLSAGAAAMDLSECPAVFKKASEAPYSLSIGDYDAVEVCAATIKAMKVSSAQNDREDRTYRRNLNLKDDE